MTLFAIAATAGSAPPTQHDTARPVHVSSFRSSLLILADDFNVCSVTTIIRLGEANRRRRARAREPALQLELVPGDERAPRMNSAMVLTNRL